ncbi:MAG TPA: DUF1569 domain-containing protein [Hanamia sp.]|nr:DUF1569 domain-containing protein [Hanamia sp.]
MNTLFDKTTNYIIISRIEKLRPSSKARWGKMNVTKMLAHLDLSFQANFGEIVLKRDILLSTIFKPVARRILLGKKPFWKNMPTDKKLLPQEPVDFFEEQQKVIEMIKKYVTHGPEIISKNPHNILGKITAEQSAFISYKHVDHHLRQFGVESI